MATTYKLDKSDAGYLIYRDGEHVATYEPVEEKLSWVEPEFKRFQNHVMREVNALTAPAKPIEPVQSTDVAVIAQPKVEDTPLTDAQRINQLKAQVFTLQVENAKLTDEIKKLRGQSMADGGRLNPRFSDTVDLTNAPATDPNLGDLTPAFIEWMRKNVSPEIFARRYAGRIASKPENK